ncbi:MAG: hypothetical protein ABIF71_04265 [Planctomycetota bacterium]
MDAALEAGTSAVLVVPCYGNVPAARLDWAAVRLYRWDWGTDPADPADDQVTPVATTEGGTPTLVKLGGRSAYATTGIGRIKRGGRYQLFLVRDDSDDDGLPDAFENRYGVVNPAADPDGDGLTNLDELQRDTRPDLDDTDGDGLSDGDEVAHGFDPLNPRVVRTDTDNDNMADQWELCHFGDLTHNGSADGDADQMPDLTEYIIGSDPTTADANTDGDGLADVWELFYAGGLGVLNNLSDPDGDGLSAATEQNRGPNPLKADSDGDKLADNVETRTGIWISAANTGTNPVAINTDRDGLRDGVETNTNTFVDRNDTGTNPNNPDHDGDTYRDGVEVEASMNPCDPGSYP